ncbi:hypothetical protein [Paenibacillus sp. 1P07SE]|uniref:hypothetical protein n=1 Tax=Paenibacillus sp. 1P07SE TaxID=3132209 RepID=UPI0039A48D56
MDKPLTNLALTCGSRQAYSWLGVVMILLLSIPVTGMPASVERPAEAADHPALSAPGESSYLTAPRYLQPKKLIWAGYGFIVIVVGALYYRRVANVPAVPGNAWIGIRMTLLKLAPVKHTSIYVSRFCVLPC